MRRLWAFLVGAALGWLAASFGLRAGQEAPDEPPPPEPPPDLGQPIQGDGHWGTEFSLPPFVFVVNDGRLQPGAPTDEPAGWRPPCQTRIHIYAARTDRPRSCRGYDFAPLLARARDDAVQVYDAIGCPDECPAKSPPEPEYAIWHCHRDSSRRWNHALAVWEIFFTCGPRL